jgi:hypothetical protein
MSLAEIRAGGSLEKHLVMKRGGKLGFSRLQVRFWRATDVTAAGAHHVRGGGAAARDGSRILRGEGMVD